MATNARVGILIPGSFAGTPPTLSEFTAFFRRADDLGLHSLWVIDRIFHQNSVFDPMTLLTCAAAVTSRVRLGTSVLLFALRNPILMAKTTATLDYLSGGRLTLGVSLGGRGSPMTWCRASSEQALAGGGAVADGGNRGCALRTSPRPAVPPGRRAVISNSHFEILAGSGGTETSSPWSMKSSRWSQLSHRRSRVKACRS